MRIVEVGAGGRWRRVEHHEEVGSTNAVVAARAADEEPGLVVVADHQTAGRGRLDRSWEDAPGRSLLMSALVDHDPSSAGVLPFVAGLALVDAVREVGIEAALKWPNDVLVGGRKCAGILVERAGAERAVVGIGVNVDLRGVAHDPAWASLADALDGDVDRWELLDALLTALDRRLDEPAAQLLSDYRRSCVTVGQDVEVTVGGGVVVGHAEGVADDGALLVRSGDRVLEIRAGDVVHVRPAV